MVMLFRTLVICFVLLVQCSPLWAVYGVRLSDLTRTPVPPNPVRVWGRVISESPIRISDGKAEITVVGAEVSSGQYVVLTGEWDGLVLDCGSKVAGEYGPAKIEMVWVPAGSFLMGNTGVGQDSYNGMSIEYPQHSVYLSGYWIGKYEVTRKQYRLFMEAGGYTNRVYWTDESWAWVTSLGRTQPDLWAPQQNWGTGTFTQTDAHPVVGVTYYEAEAFCRWAGVKLPTEAQWEKAARWDPVRSHPNIFSWGDLWVNNNCNNDYDNDPIGGGLFAAQTTPVGSYPQGVSPYGCMDMMGNVGEWCQDWYGPDYYSQTPEDGWRNPTGPLEGLARSIRGGSWMEHFDGCRCAYRSAFNPNYSRRNFGFRVAR